MLEALNHQQSCAVDDFKGNFINKFTGESSNESKSRNLGMAIVFRS